MLDKLVANQVALNRQTQKLLRQEVYRPLTEPFLGLPGLVGFWPMSSVQRSTGNAYDLSGQGRTLTYNGNPTYNIYNNLAPYIDLDGTGDYLSRTDETDLDILGTETIYAAGVRGLTVGGWFWFDRSASSELLIGKWGASGNYAYYLVKGGSDKYNFIISDNGTNTPTAITPDNSTFAVGLWTFLCGTFFPSTSLNVFVNSSKFTNTTSIPASLFNSSAALTIGQNAAGSQNLDGRASLCFLCANALPDSLIQYLFEATRWAFGV